MILADISFCGNPREPSIGLKHLFDNGYVSIGIALFAWWMWGAALIELALDLLDGDAAPADVLPAVIPIFVTATITWQALRFVWSHVTRLAKPKARIAEDPPGFDRRHQSLRISGNGLCIRQDRRWTVYRWATFKTFTRKTALVILHMSDDSEIIVPNSMFEGDDQIEAFCLFVEMQKKSQASIFQQ